MKKMRARIDIPLDWLSIGRGRCVPVFETEFRFIA